MRPPEAFFNSLHGNETSGSPAGPNSFTESSQEGCESRFLAYRRNWTVTTRAKRAPFESLNSTSAEAVSLPAFRRTDR